MSNKVCVPNETEDLNLHVFNITVINKSKTLTKHISCKCKLKFNSKRCNLNQKWNSNKFCCECKNPKEHHIWEKSYISNPVTCSCKNSKSVGHTDNSVVICSEIIDIT